ncbi:hypothetical protein TNCV_697371, partial [Trichonephila clavipes]
MRVSALLLPHHHHTHRVRDSNRAGQERLSLSSHLNGSINEYQAPVWVTDHLTGTSAHAPQGP